MKRLTATILTIILIFSALNLTILASGSAPPKLTVSSTQAEPGEIITINVNLKNNPGIISACINVSFDAGLTLIDAKNGNVFPPSISFTKPKQLSNGNTITGNCNFAWSGTDIKDKDIKDGEMLVLSFAVSGNAMNGDSYIISVTTRKGDIVDRDLSVIDLGSANGQVNIFGESSVADENTERALRSILDLLKRLIAIIKEVFSTFGKL